MRRTSRRHPLQSFSFWFLVLATVGAVAAWRLGWLPVRSATDDSQAAAFQRLTADEDEALSAGVPDADRLDDLPLAQSEPETSSPAAASATPESSHPASRSVTAGGETTPREMPRVNPVEENPFSVAEPEFTAAEGAGQREPDRVLSGIGVNSDAGVSGEIVLAGNEEPVEPAQPEAAVDAESPDASTEAAGVDLTEIETLLNEGTVEADIEAHRRLSELYWSRPEARPRIMEHLETTARRIYFQPQPHYMQPYVVQSGENLESIARRYNVSWEYLARLNRISDARRLRAGQELKVIKGPFDVLIDMSDYELTVHAHGYFVYRFPVGIGKDGSTPQGTFVVEEKLVNPTYYGPDGVIAADDPLNPLGERWIDIGNSYGIHGTIEPETIGQGESRGCIRMHNRDVEVVYDLLTVGSEVVIQR